MLISAFWYTTLVITALVFVVAMFRYTQLHTRGGKSLAAFIGFKFAFETIFFVTCIQHTNNMPLAYVYSFFETLLLVWVVQRMPFMRSKMRVVWFFALLVLAGIAGEAVVNWPLHELNTWSRVGEGVFVFILFGHVLLRLAETPRWSLLYNLPETWLCLSVLAYFSLHLAVAFINNYAIHRYGIAYTAPFWILNFVANIISNLFLLWSLLIPLKRAP